MVINEIHYNSDDNSVVNEFVELHNTASASVDISGWLFDDGISFTFPQGSRIPARGYVVVAQRPSVILSEFGITAFGPYQGKLSSDGERVALTDKNGVLIDKVSYKPTFPWPIGADGTGASMELINPTLDNDMGGSWRSSVSPTPGRINSQWTDNAPPQISKVIHDPQQPTEDQTTIITAKVTDPDKVASVTLSYQVVTPGQYIPAVCAKSTSELLANPEVPREPNPAYEIGWVTIPMLDNGLQSDASARDDIFTAVVPAQSHRTLVRYRITVKDTKGHSVRVPYADDESLNFAYFVYNGVPEYVAKSRSVLGKGHRYSAEVMTSVPVYHLLTTSEDFDQAVAYNGSNQIPSNNFEARKAYNWSGTFVYDGQVYDNIGYRLRQRNARYSGQGKRSFKYDFNRGHYPYFKDMYGQTYSTDWKKLSSHKLTGSRNNVYWGLDQAANHLLWNLYGTPASYTHWFELRVIKQAQEVSSGTQGQYFGDFYGLMLAMEEYDSQFIKSHALAKGNIYKLLSYQTNGLEVREYLAQDAVNDGSDFANIIYNLRPEQSDLWLDQHVNYDQWYRYHAIMDAVRHYDVQPNTAEHLKNRFYYFEPSDASPLGRLWSMPWDSDTSWGPNWNGGEDFCKQAIYGYGGNAPRTEFIREYQNVVREFRDLAWTEEQIDLLIDPLASSIAELVPADRDRWTYAPSAAGSQNDPSLESVVSAMKQFAFIGGSWTGGNDSLQDAISRDSGVSGRQGRDAYLDALAKDTKIPATPMIVPSGQTLFPINQLVFETLNYSGSYTFAAWKWRIAEVTLPQELPLNEPPKYEIKANWESEEISNKKQQTILIPMDTIRVGARYRVRVRAKDITGRWSHWSAPIEFITAEPDMTN